MPELDCPENTDMKLFRTVQITILVSLLAFGSYQFAKSTRVDDAVPREPVSESDERMQEPVPKPGDGMSRLGETAPPIVEDRQVFIAPESTIPQPSVVNDPSHAPALQYGDAVAAESDENGDQLDIDVSVVMADGTTKTFTGAGVMFSQDGKAMAIPKGGYRVLADGTLMPDADPGAETQNGPVSP
ncbi:MAG: hypothetical protein ABL934_06725 [Lysobacteraceae bacterium]